METSKEYIIEIGRRIAERRKELGLTQAELGRLLSVTQQEIASYERGLRQIPVGRLPCLAQALSMTIENLLVDENSINKKRGPATKLQQQIEAVSCLSKSEQQFVSKLLDQILTAHAAK